MDDIRLTYSKSWRNPADFPAVEADEAKVRADMQLLYDEIQTFLNDTLIPAMKNLETPAFENLPTENAVSTSKEKIPTSFAVSNLFATTGNMPVGGAAGQFLVKKSEKYGDAVWETHSIPRRMSDLEALDENGDTVNAQVLIEDVADKARSHYAELIASGSIGFGDTSSPDEAVIDLGDVTAFERILVVFFSNPDGNVVKDGALYLGAWNGRYISSTDTDGGTLYTPDGTGMVRLSLLDTYGFQVHTHCDLAFYPFRDSEDMLLVYEQDRQNTSGGSQSEDGPRVLPPEDIRSVDRSKLSVFARASYKSGADDGTRETPYRVYGIRRGSKEG